MQLGKDMIKQGLIAHVTDEHDFGNELYWYRFADIEAERGKDIEVRYQIIYNSL